MAFLLFMVFWFAMCIGVGIIAANKGRSGSGYFFLAFFLSPLVGLIAVLASKSSRDLAAMFGAHGEFRKCPFCAEAVKKEAVVCRYCNKDLTAPRRSDANAPVEQRVATGGPLGSCPNCSEIIPMASSTCPRCYVEFSAPSLFRVNPL